VTRRCRAANAHNTQPWLFELGTDRIDLFADISRSMGTMDPLRREMVVSLGCALENLALAARANGLEPTIELLPVPADETHVARVELSPGPQEPSVLYLAIPDRHTDRAAYDTARPVEASTLEELAGLNDEPDVSIVWITDPGPMRSFGELTVRATEAIVADPEQAADDYAWYRFDWDEIQAMKDGITFDASGATPMMRSLVKLIPTPSIETSGDGWVTVTRDRHVATAAAFGFVTASDRGDDRQRLLAGRLYQRLHLSLTSRGAVDAAPRAERGAGGQRALRGARAGVHERARSDGARPPGRPSVPHRVPDRRDHAQPTATGGTGPGAVERRGATMNAIRRNWMAGLVAVLAVLYTLRAVLVGMLREDEMR
jgi:hypothetical protein